MISGLIYYLFELVIFIIIIDCVLSWIPNVKFYKQPFAFIHAVSSLFLAPARKIVPPIGGLDISPIFVVIFLQFCSSAVTKLFMIFGL